jgi:hypothetical protein
MRTVDWILEEHGLVTAWARIVFFGWVLVVVVVLPTFALGLPDAPLDQELRWWETAGLAVAYLLFLASVFLMVWVSYLVIVARKLLSDWGLFLVLVWAVPYVGMPAHVSYAAYKARRARASRGARGQV